MSADIVVVGSLNHDLTVVAPHHPRPGETVLGTRHYSGNGGKGANQAVAAARLGGSVAMIGLVGDDDYGTSLRSALKVEGIDVTGVGTDPDTPTGLAVITIDANSENTIVVSPGANTALSPTHIENQRDLLSKAGVVLAQLEVPIDAVRAAADQTGATFCLNPAPAAKLPMNLADRIDILVPNRSELASLAGVSEPVSTDEVAAAVDRLDLKGIVIVTLGSDGALVVDGNRLAHVEAPRVDAVDPTGAGDAFCGALAVGLSRGLHVGAAVERAVIAGALATTRPGAQTAMPNAVEVDSLLAS